MAGSSREKMRLRIKRSKRDRSLEYSESASKFLSHHGEGNGGCLRLLGRTVASTLQSQSLHADGYFLRYLWHESTWGWPENDKKVGQTLGGQLDSRIDYFDHGLRGNLSRAYPI